MAFVDELAFWEATILVGSVLLGYVGFTIYWAIRRNDAMGVRAAMRGAAAPVGGIGAVAMVLGLWGEAAWQLPGSYNILFTDVYLMFGVTMVMLAVSLATASKLQYTGLLALVAGGMTVAYGWNGYVLGMTKEPFEMFLLYGAFGLAGILSFPATVVADHFLAHADGTAFPLGAPATSTHSRPSLLGATRAAQPIVPMENGNGADVPVDFPSAFRVPPYISVIALAFVASMGLAAYAALSFLNTTLPAHLASAP